MAKSRKGKYNYVLQWKEKYHNFALFSELYLMALFIRDNAAKLAATMDKLFVLFGVEILKIVPGRVSTEVDARWLTTRR